MALLGAAPFEHWVGWAVRRARWIAVGAVAATVLSLYYAATHLRVDTDRDKMIAADLPFKVEEARVDALFPALANNLVVVVDGQTPEGARDAALELAAELRARSELFAGVDVPRADPFLERHALLFQSVDSLAELIDRLAEVQPILGRLARDPSTRALFGLLTEAYAARAAGRAAPLGDAPARLAESLATVRRGEPGALSWQELLSAAPPAAEARRQYVLAQPRLDYARLFPARPAIEALRELSAGLERERGVHVRVTGTLAMAHEELETVMSGMELVSALVFVLVAATLYVALRSWRLVLAVVATLVVGLAITSAFALLAVGHLNLISVVFAAMYLGLGVDYAIHLCLRYRELTSEGLGVAESMRRAAGDIGESLTLCALTTALGFYAFVPTAYAGVSELGIITGTGMFVSLAVTLTLLPALIVLARNGGVDGAPPGADEPARAPFARPAALRWISTAIALAGFASLPWLRFDPNPLRLRDEASESVATFRDLLANSSTPPWSLTVIAADAQEERELRERLGGLPGVARVVSLASFVPEDQPEKLELLEEAGLLLGPGLGAVAQVAPPDDAAPGAAARALLAELERWLALPESAGDEGAHALRDELAAWLAAADEPERWQALEGALIGNLPANLARLSAALSAGELRADALPAELAARWVAPEGARRIELFAKGDLDDPAEMRAFVDEVLAVAPQATGAPRTILASGDAVVGAFRQALALAVIVIALVVALLLRNSRDTLLVLAPLLLAGLATGATLVVLGIPFDFANVIALPLLLGIGVDSAIHVVHRARSQGVERLDLRRNSTGQAVLYSGVTTLVSFVALSFSSHPGTARMGVALSVGVTWTLVAALVFLPAWLERDRPVEAPEASPGA